MEVWFNSFEGDVAGNIKIKFSLTAQYSIGYCSSTYIDFPANLPTDTDKVWRITKSPGPKLQIFCNEVEMVNILMSVCENSDWNTYWTRQVARINFFSSSRTQFYRPYIYSGSWMQYMVIRKFATGRAQLHPNLARTEKWAAEHLS